MHRVVIFGNSGSGKSTLAKEICQTNGLPHLDLDSIAWLPVTPPKRRPLQDSQSTIDTFLSLNNEWVVEGCYSDLISLIIDKATKVIFLNLSIDDCIANAKSRPWEPHKYQSKEAQDANLDMLIEWISQYQIRQDDFSLSSHQRLFNEFSGNKIMYRKNGKR